MFCPNCGTQNENEALFCENCGTNLIPPSNMQKEITEEIPPIPGYVDEAKRGAGKNPFRKKKLIRAEVFLLIILAAGILFTYQTIHRPEAVAKKWVKANIEQDWNRVYSMLYLNEGNNKFLTKQDFVTTQTISSAAKSEDTFQILNVKEQKNISSSRKKEVIIAYMLGNSEEQESLELIKKKGKWKVNSGSIYAYYTEAITLKIPEGGTLKVNQQKINKSYKANTEKGYDTYSLGKMFTGLHDVQISVEDRKDFHEIMDIPAEVETITMQYTDDVVNKISKQAQADLNTIMQSVAANQKVSKVAPIMAADETCRPAMLEQYDALGTYVMQNDETESSTQLNLTDNIAQVQTVQLEDGTSGIQVTIDSSFNYDISYSASYGGNQVHSNTGREKNTLAYTYKDEKWVLYDLELCTSYY